MKLCIDYLKDLAPRDVKSWADYGHSFALGIVNAADTVRGMLSK